VQRALLRAGAFEPLASFILTRLDGVTEPRARRWADVVAAGLTALRHRVAGWPGLSAAERELDARPVADTLYHVLQPPVPPATVFTAAECAWLPALIDWTEVPLDAVAEPAGGR
jgi:hypothetical protein